MKIVFCLYKYFCFGGLQRDFIQILLACQKRGHHIRVFTMSWDGKVPDHINVNIIQVKAYTNHGCNQKFYNQVKDYLIKYQPDVVVGFNKMPGLDVYFAADVCYAEKAKKEKNCFYKLTKRYKHYIAYEKAVFCKKNHTKLLMLTQYQINIFKKHYKTPDKRFHLLPPGVDPSIKYNQCFTEKKEIYRKKNNVSKNQFFLLQVGSDFRRKGVDRMLKSIASLPKIILNKIIAMVVGQDDSTSYKLLAKKLNIHSQVLFFYGRHDIAELMAAADILIHPAYQEAAGIVLVEAVAAGLPVITTETCGYAYYIRRASCGIVITEPYRQKKLNDALTISLSNKSLLKQWSKSARQFADTQDLFSLHEKAADIITGC